MGMTTQSQFGRLWSWFLALTVLAGSLHTLPAATVAILPGERERAPSAELVARLEVALSSAPDTALVERAQLHRIMAEQRLDAAGLLKPSASIQLGKLVGADVFLFINQFTTTNSSIIEGRWLEARTGIVLEKRLFEARTLADDLGPVLAQHQSALRRLAVAPGQRHPMAILGFRSEEPGREFDGAIAALEAMVSAGLWGMPEVLLMDREHLDQLVAEKHLAGGELNLAGSALLLEGGIRHTPDRTKWVATARVKFLSGTEVWRDSVTVSPADLAQARDHLVEALASHLKTSVKVQAGDTEREAKEFSDQVGILFSHGEHQASSRAAEAAFALCPCLKHRIQLADNLSAVSYSQFTRTFGYSSRFKPVVSGGMLHMAAHPDIPSEQKQKYYQRLSGSGICRSPLWQSIKPH